MPTDPTKREKQVMKKRRKEKAAAKKKSQQGLWVASDETLARKAREFPILECMIASDWQDDDEMAGLVQVVVARKLPTGALVTGVYLVDIFCLGLKDTFYDANVSVGEYRDGLLKTLDSMMPMEKCKPELAHQLIYQAIDYAAQFGFKPNRDFRVSQYILEERGKLPEPHDIKFGRNGKPFFVQGPHDNVRAIIAQLERAAGQGNYDTLIVMP